MLMRTPEFEPPRRPERLLARLLRHMRRPSAPVRPGRVDDLSERLRADIGAPPRLPTRMTGPFDY